MWPFDQNNQPMYQQYAQAYDTGNYHGLDHNQSLGYMQQFMQSAPPDMQEQIFQQHFAQMPYDQRALFAQQVPPQYGLRPDDPWSMAQGFMRVGREQPHLLRGIFSHPVLLSGALGIAGLIAKHMLSHNQGGGAYGGQGYGYNPQQQYMQQELNQERREEQELRRELRAEERREERLEERLEDRGRHHHHHERDY